MTANKNEPLPHQCDRCSADAVLRILDDGNEKRLCQEHGYAGQWLTTTDRLKEMERYRARGLDAGALIAGAMFMIKRHRDWPSMHAPPSPTVGLSRADGHWWFAALAGGVGVHDIGRLTVGSASDSVVRAILRDVAWSATATRMVAVDSTNAVSLVPLLDGSTNPALAVERRHEVVIEVDMNTAIAAIGWPLSKLVERLVAACPGDKVTGQHVLRDEVCERTLTAAYTARLAANGHTTITSGTVFPHHVPTSPQPP